MSFEELTPAKQLQVLKRRIGGYRTAFNTKVTGGTALAKQAIGPPAMHSDTVAQQLAQRMAELDEPFNKLKATLQDIIKRVETDDDEKDFLHYNEYLNKIISELDEAKQYITEAIEAVGEQSKANSVVVAPSDSSSESDDGGGGGAARTRRRRPKACSDLRPDKLTKDTKPAQFQTWMRSHIAYWDASHFAHSTPATQHEYLRKVVDKGLMQLIEKNIKNDMPVVPIEDKPELSSVLDLLKAECLARHPMVGRRYELFRTEQAAGTSLSEYINKLRDSATNAELTDLDANGLICYYALATCKDTYLSVKEDALKLPPEELTLDKLMSLARIHESAQNALRDISRSAASTNSTHSRGSSGSGGGGGKKEPKKPDRMPQYLWDHILKLRAEGRCSICGKPISDCPDRKKCKASFEDSNNSCSWCHGAHAAAVCAKKANNMKSESESTKGKGKGKNSWSNYQRNKGAEARATADQQQHPGSDSDDDPATTSYTFFTGNDAQLATNDSTDDEPAQAPRREKRGKTPALLEMLKSSVAFCRRLATPLVKRIAPFFRRGNRATHAAHSYMTNAQPVDLEQEGSAKAGNRTPASAWLPKRPKHMRHGSIATPRVKLEFFQHGGNHDTAFIAKTIPDTGSSQSIFGSTFVDKYNLKVDESAEAKARRLYNASNEKMAVRGIVDIQAMYNGTMVTLDGLVLESDLVAPLISWHDLTQLRICNLPDNLALCNFCADTAAKSRLVSNAIIPKGAQSAPSED